MTTMFPRNATRPSLVKSPQPYATLSDIDLQVIRLQTGLDTEALDRLTSAGGGYTIGRREDTFILPSDVAALQMPVGMSLGDWLRHLIDKRRREREHHHHHHHEPFPVPGGGSVGGGMR